MAKTKTERIVSIDEQIRQLEAQKKQLIQKQKLEERKERTHRLCKRHGLLEMHMPDLITLTDEQFETFIKRAINTGYGRKILAEIIAQSGAPASPAHVETPDASIAGSGTNPPKAEQSGA